MPRGSRPAPTRFAGRVDEVSKPATESDVGSLNLLIAGGCPPGDPAMKAGGRPLGPAYETPLRVGLPM